MVRTLFLVALILLSPIWCFATFSIVAIDPKTGEMGIAVASRVLAVGAQVAWAEADVGVIARQADLNLGYGPRAIELLKTGMKAQQVLDRLLEEHPSSSHQIAIVDAKGNVAVSTGPDALKWNGHKKGVDYSVQGNVLVGPQVLDAMARAFEQSMGPLAERLFTALKAGDDAGGDRRGRQSASMLVVKKRGGFGQDNDRVVCITVDDLPNPVPELRRLLNVQLAWNFSSSEGDLMAAGKLQEARSLAEKAVALVPDNSYFLIELGFLTYLVGQKEEALKHFQKGSRIDKRFAEVWDTYRGDLAFKSIFEDRQFVDKVFNGR